MTREQEQLLRDARELIADMSRFVGKMALQDYSLLATVPMRIGEELARRERCVPVRPGFYWAHSLVEGHGPGLEVVEVWADPEQRLLVSVCGEEGDFRLDQFWWASVAPVARP
jgi:hypothetical protein